MRVIPVNEGHRRLVSLSVYVHLYLLTCYYYPLVSARSGRTTHVGRISKIAEIRIGGRNVYALAGIGYMAYAPQAVRMYPV